MTERPTVIAIYRPKPGQAEALLDLVRRHVPLLREAGLATAAEVVLLQSRKDGCLLELFEWTTEDAPTKAHGHPQVGPYWEAMAAVSDFETLASLEEAGQPFAHFNRL